jgi:hypothetical protein
MNKNQTKQYVKQFLLRHLKVIHSIQLTLVYLRNKLIVSANLFPLILGLPM